ncbi:MAG: NAD(P)/FAD-dependent oxidoreductase, partial [Nitrososphaerales archaeon]
MTTRYRSLIVGGGIAGLSLAYELSRLGEERICLVDEGIENYAPTTSSMNKKNATLDSAGIVASQLWPPLDPVYAKETMEIVREVIGVQSASRIIQPLPSLVLCSEQPAQLTLNELQERMKTEGLDSEILRGEDLKGRFPYLRSDLFISGSYTSTGLLVQPARYMAKLMALYREKGGETRKGRVQKIIEEDGRVIGTKTDAGTLRAEKVIVAAGTNSETLLKK